MARNVIKEVANVLGIALEEEFTLYLDKGKNIYKLSDSGLIYWDNNEYKWNHSDRLERLLLGCYEINKVPKQILTEKEKEYLSNIVKPFKDKIVSIVKYINCYDSYEFIRITIRQGISDACHIILPTFTSETMYKCMRTDKEYTLKELGL